MQPRPNAYRPRYWVAFGRDSAPGLVTQPVVMSLEPEVSGTWKVRVRFQGEDLMRNEGLDYPSALDTLLSAYGLVLQNRGRPLDA